MAGKKLLVADDSLTIQKVIRLALSNEGYDIQAVSDGNDAIQQISLFRPDVVLIDVSLPGKNAYEAKAIINQQGDFPDLKFVLMSSAFEKVDEAQIQSVVFHARLTKPFDPAHLRQILNEVLATVPSSKSVPPFDEPSIEDHRFDSPPPVMPEMPVVSSPKQEVIESLWDKNDAFANIAPPPLPGASQQESLPDDSEDFPMGAGATGDGPDAEIKHLTESTIRMSGLDDFQWSINESAKKPSLPAEPEPAPPPLPHSVGDTTLANFRRKEPSLKPPTSLSDMSGSNFRLDLDPPPAEQFNAFEEPPTPPAPPAPSHASEPQAIPLTAGQMEAILKKQLEETLERMAREILPQVAERVIKAEINRMLQDT